jgi:hypothetical protein
LFLLQRGHMSDKKENYKGITHGTPHSIRYKQMSNLNRTFFKDYNIIA